MTGPNDPKPILVPGHPGDLRLIFETSLETMALLEAAGREPGSSCRAVAETVKHALEMWLGEREIPNR